MYRQMEKNSNCKWSAADDSRLLELKVSGESDRAIADVLKRSASAIEQRLNLLRDRANNSAQ